MDISSIASGGWFDDNKNTIINICLVIIVSWAIKIFGEIFVRKAVRKAIKPSKFASRTEERKREDTIIQIITNAMNILIWPIAFIIIVGMLGVNIAPLLAGAGVVGLAIGFGAQSLVKDVISGLFIISENQYRVGDVLKLNNEVSGLVEAITLRITILRDLDGIVHTIPNGLIELTSNYSKEKSGVNLNVGVSYDTDIEKAEKIINRIGEEMIKDPEWSDKIIEQPVFLRVDNLGDSSVELKIIATTKPLAQWEVTGELRKRVLIEFRKAKIEIPLPQRVIHSK